MEKEDIFNYMKQPETMDKSTVEELQQLVEEYPYFQTARLLYTQSLHAVQDARYSDELGKTAIFCADRGRLFYLIHSERYEQLLKQPGSETLSDTDRTEVLLDSYLRSFEAHDSPKEQERAESTEIPVSGEHAASIDYFAYLETSGEGIDTGGQHRQPLQHQDIIDAFIKKADNDSIRPAPAKEWVPPAAEEAQEEAGSEFLTETLAKIYIKQKKYEQALTIIKRLSLNFPKKSAYFADQIRFLEYLIINEKNKNK
jgi:hypothetical protein